MNKAEELIACLEGEIAKRDEELAACRVAVENCDLFRARIAEIEEKTRTAMGVGGGSGNLFVYGDYDSIKAAQKIVIERDQLRAELSAIKAQEPVAWAGAIEYGVPLLMVEPQNWKATPLYAAPVSEAKAQGVVQWPEADEIMQMAFEEGQPADDASGYYFELEEFDLFIERLMSEVARLNAAQAAPAADAGLDYQAMFDAIAAATSVYANGAVNISVQAFRESLAAHSAEGVV